MNVSLRGFAQTIMVLWLLGLLSGLTIADAEILNPWGSQVEAEVLEQTAIQQAERAQLEYDHFQQQLADENIARQNRLQDEKVYRQQQDALRLSLQEWFGTAVIIILFLAAICGLALITAHLWPKQRVSINPVAPLKMSRETHYTPAYLRPIPKQAPQPSTNGRYATHTVIPH